MNPKNGISTTEFLLSALVTVVSLVLASGVVSDGHWLAQALGFVSAALTSAGYSYSRAVTKSSASQAEATASLLVTGEDEEDEED